MKLHEALKPTLPGFSIWTPGHSGVFVIKKGLTSLQGAPKKVDLNFNCSGNKLTTLEGGPQRVGGYYNCGNNELTSLQGAPSHIGWYFSCHNNKLTNLHNIHKVIKSVFATQPPASGYRSFYCYGNPIEHSILGLCLIDGIESVRFSDEKVDKIINSVFALTKDKSERLLKVQDLLIDNGFEKLARL